jgi:predicted site-specific integrase-resolvase
MRVAAKESVFLDNYLLKSPEAARVLGVQPQTLREWRATGRVKIPYIRLGKRCYYQRAALQKFLASKTVGAGTGKAGRS